MHAIVRGTTPTIRWTFRTVSLDSIVKAILLIKRGQSVEIEKPLSEATVDTENKTIEWTLTQAETLGLSEFKEYTAHCDWLLADGTRGAGKVTAVKVFPPGKDKVITSG